MRATPQRPSDRGRISPEQVHWINTRDRVGRAIDGYLRSHPEPHMREVTRQVEECLRLGDHRVGLTP